MFMCVRCFGFVVSTCQVIGFRKTPMRTPVCGEEIICTKPRFLREYQYLYVFCVLFVYVTVCFPRVL